MSEKRDARIDTAASGAMPSDRTLLTASSTAVRKSGAYWTAMSVAGLGCHL